MKVKLIFGSMPSELEKTANEFLSTLSNEQVIDIKYSSSDDYSEILIVYDETKAAK